MEKFSLGWHICMRLAFHTWLKSSYTCFEKFFTQDLPLKSMAFHLNFKGEGNDFHTLGKVLPCIQLLKLNIYYTGSFVLSQAVLYK